MKRAIIFVVITLTCAGAGIGAGLHFRPSPTTVPTEPETEHAPVPHAEAEAPDYVRMTNQFVIPLVDEGHIRSLVVMSLSLEVRHGQSEAVHAKEPKLRDSFLQILFDHANSGAFDGTFTEGNVLDRLRQSLLSEAGQILPDIVSDVLITDIGRQDS
jgi:flagellar basal body-associated protein FliL